MVPRLIAVVVLLAACRGGAPAAEPAPTVENVGAPPIDAAPAPDAIEPTELELAIGTIRRRVDQVEVDIGVRNGDALPRELCMRVLPTGPNGLPIEDDLGSGLYSSTGEPCSCILGDDSWAHGERFKLACVECTCDAGVARRCGSTCDQR